MGLKKHLQEVTAEQLARTFQGLDAKTDGQSEAALREERVTRELAYPGMVEFPAMLANAFLSSGFSPEQAQIIHMAASLTIDTLIEFAEIQELPSLDLN